ncbi:SGS-domain-containing protein [Xylaria nigripes]|nr:SGS-domain-containing protein [Xylaria nigripes]
MSSSTALAGAGVDAVSAGKYAEGIEKLTEALEGRSAPLWYLERSKAYLRTNQIDLALYDAEMALRIAFDRANRDQMMEAQLRRAITLFRMGRFADADVCAFWATRLSDGSRATEDDGQLGLTDENGDYSARAKHVQDTAKSKPEDGLATALNASSVRSKTASLRNQAFTWRIQALTQMENLPAGHYGRKVHLSVKYPELSQITSMKKAAEEASPAVVSGDNAASKSSTSPAPSHNTSGRDAWEGLWNRYRTMYMKHKIRCSFYQTETSLTVDIFLKNLSPEQIAIESRSRAIKISPKQGVSLGGLNGPIWLLLSGAITPEATKYNVKSMKIELVLQKQTPGKWQALRRENAGIVDNLSLSLDQFVPFDPFFSFITALGYQDVEELELPDFDEDQSAWYAALLGALQSKIESIQELGSLSSSKAERSDPSSHAVFSQSKNSVAEAKPSISATAQKSNAPAYPTSSKTGPKNWDHIVGTDDDENAKDSDVNAFFQSLYKDGDEDTRRAMMKSFIESNGTALSTSWNEAKGKTYETNAPDGAEVKKWE